MAHYIYESAPRPVPEVAIVAALGFLSGICGKSFLTPTGTGLNQYIILVARSAVGKEAMHSGISRLMNHATKDLELPEGRGFVDFSDFASGPALQKAFTVNRSFVNVAGEFGLRLQQIARSTNKPDSPMQTLRRVMTSLYSKSSPGDVAGGIRYSDAQKNVLSVGGVAYSLIGETTPDTFYELITPDMMADGFMSRFTVIEYTGDRPPENEAAYQKLEPDPALVDYLRRLMAQSLNLLNQDRTQGVNFHPDAEALLKAFNLECDRNIRHAGNDDSRRQMWNRAHLKALKIGSLLAVADNFVNPVMATHQAEWAIELVRRDTGVFTSRLESGDIGSGDDARETKIIEIVRRYFAEPLSHSASNFEPLKGAGIIPRKYIQQWTQRVAAFANHRLGATKAMDEALRSLIDSGHLSEVPKLQVAEYGYHGKAYRPLGFQNLTVHAAPWIQELTDMMQK